MKTLLIFLAAACVSLSSCSKKPEAILVKRLETAEQIMKDNMEKPAAGVDKLIKYFEKNGPDTVKLVMEAGIKLSKIEGKGDREKRVEEIQKALSVAFKNFQGTSEKFGKAVAKDDNAKTRMKEYSERWEALGSMMSNVARF